MPTKSKPKRPPKLDPRQQARYWIKLLLDDIDDKDSPLHDQPELQEGIVKALLDSVDWGTLHSEQLVRVFDPLLENEFISEELAMVAKREHFSTCACCRKKLADKVAERGA